LERLHIATAGNEDAMIKRIVTKVEQDVTQRYTNSFDYVRLEKLVANEIERLIAKAIINNHRHTIHKAAKKLLQDIVDDRT
jgi:hypothetical protein